VTRARLWPAVVTGWTLAAAVLTLVAAPAIANLWFPDPDDAMRLLEVRDWLAGQSWWDVSQHRLWGGGFAMHWSRLVDLPLALVILLLDPIVGQLAAGRVAMVAVPLATLLVVMALVARLTATLGGIERARLAVLLTALSPPIVYQIRPMRIDHHGWQVALALAAVAALVARPTWRSGALAGACLGALVTVSLEGLPITAAILGVALLAWVYAPDRRDQALAMTAALLASVVALHVATRGPGMFAAACDAIAPVWIAALALSCTGVAATLLIAPAARALRIAGLAGAAVAGAAMLRLAAPICTRGPFATLDPLVYRLWYSNVAEGLPAWQQLPASAVMAYALPLVGLGGAIVAWRASTGDAQVRWAMMAAIAAAALSFSLLIIRGAATANALALPGAAWLLLGWLTRARSVRHAGLRTAATAAAFLGAAPGLAGVLLAPPDPTPPPNGARIAGGTPLRWCDRGHEIGDLAALPAGRIFAPLDVTPAMVATTGHQGIGAGYHRNVAAIHRVMATFLATPDAARASVLASGARYVAGCPGDNETQRYRQLAPDGFWARLERGERFDWLEPIAVPGSPVLAWRVVRPLPREGGHP
jgi:hypothetical protein